MVVCSLLLSNDLILLNSLSIDFPTIGKRFLQTAASNGNNLPPASTVLLNRLPKTNPTTSKIPLDNLPQLNFAGLNITNLNIVPAISELPVTNRRIEEPKNDRSQKIETPITIIKEITEKNLDNILGFDFPSNEGQNKSIECAVMVEIRRLKMKKHKLKKLRKKMKFVYAKRRQRRKLRKEKVFQAELLAQIKEAENFSAEKYVSDKLAKLKEVPKTKREIIRIF